METRSAAGYAALPREAARNTLDFDDTSHWNIAEEDDFTLVTLDQDVNTVQQESQVMFL